MKKEKGNISNSKVQDFEQLKKLISEDKIFLLPHKKYKGLRQTYVYARCGMSLEYFDKAYRNADVILQFGEPGPRVGKPVPWQDALEDFLNGKM